ncbi:ATP-binding protein [Ruegeria sp. 2205SS24-7]|uniref:ATP-binding protein n=1 Tax=Ruegeria discodermiae TaxID=3064389 RepID=UPI00274285C8|nr:ATP-binding protein [Ruegeria sp. 2205SS24-7]MDP5216728.1 ATP-binding protein [Ruegeria sp. 2205SS24-7]
MPLNITSSYEPIEITNLVMTIYSQPGLGKTSLAFTASEPLLIDFDHGAHRAVDRRDVVLASKWSDISSMDADDLAPYDTIVIDTVGKALDALTQDIINTAPRLASAGALNQRGWGQLGVRFGAFLRRVRGFGKDVVLLSHMDEKADGEVVKERLKIQGGSKDLVLTDSDVIARISIYNRQRQFMFSPTETSFGKDPANIGSLVIPDAGSPEFKTCLAGILDRVKEGINQLSQEQIERRSEIDWFENTLPDIKTAADINEVLGRAKKAGRDVALMVAQHAKDLGLEFDPTTHAYVHPEDDLEDAPEPEEPEAA